MNSYLTPSQIYVGATIDQNSEREFLAHTVRWLEAEKIPFVVLANVHIGGRQIDCIVATEHRVSVIEVKSSHLPVRGEMNGMWTRQYASGEWRPYKNAYQQALDAKNGLRDAMMLVKQVGSFYPNGNVVFVGGLPEGSNITSGDFKVAVTTLVPFLTSLKAQSVTPWSLDDWRSFAGEHRLISIALDEIVGSREVQQSIEVLKQYDSAFAIEYGREAERWLPENEDQQRDLISKVMNGAGCFISGASGCGKTLMAKWAATSLANSGNTVFYFAAKDFTGFWGDFLRREVGFLSDQSPTSLFKAISQSGKPVFLVLDGINELGRHRQNASRGIRALARRLNARLLITSQERKSPDFDGLHPLEVNRPTNDLKNRIARSTGSLLNNTTLEVLKAVGSGVEAEIVGRIGSDLKAGATRLTIIDQYIRMRLGRYARSSSLGLRQLASFLHEQIAFSISEADFDEFMRNHAVGFEECDAFFEVNLLVKRAGRISFSHEMIQNACAAFGLARMAIADSTTLGLRLSTPVLESIAGDILSAIESTTTCHAVLEKVINPALLHAAADGDFGVIAGSVARELLNETVMACEAEIRGSRLALLKVNDVIRIDWTEDCRREWTEAELARLRAIGYRAASGSDLGSYLELCALMDGCLESERQRLGEAAREVKFPVRSQSFALAYYGFGSKNGFSYVACASHSGLIKLFDAETYQSPSLLELSSGQLHFFLRGRRSFFGDEDGECFAGQLIPLIRERFRGEPYHVKLALLDAAYSAHSAPEETREQLIEAINSIQVASTNWMINTCIVDALKALGALDNDGEENREQIRAELFSVLGDAEDMADKDLALSLCLRMFDHPFDSIYAQEIHELDEELRHRLYRRALGASDIKECMSLSWLSRQVASFDQVSDAYLMRRLTTLPDPFNSCPQEEWGGFVIAIRFLGRHQVELADIDGKMPKECCLADIRILIYAAESRRQSDQDMARQAWLRLHHLSAQLVIGCLGEAHSALTDWHWSTEEQIYDIIDLGEVYLSDCLKVARKFIKDGVDAEYFHSIPMREVGPSFAFGLIGRFGDRSDIHALRKFSNSHAFARYALVALKSLDAVSD